jgi:putative phage-type endonuclease
MHDSDYEPDNSSITSDTTNNSIVSICLLDELNETDIADITADIFVQMDDFIHDNLIEFSSPKFYESMTKHICDVLLIEWENAGLYTRDDNDFESELYEFIEQVLEVYLLFSPIPKRSRTYTVDLLDGIDNEESRKNLSEKIADLQNAPQPKQKTKEWYEFRYNLLSASSIWKALGSESQANSLIYEKCKPLTENENVFVNTETALHWGNKYEPLTVMLYESLFNTKVGEFGCIQHPKYPFIGASPDGINIEPSNQVRYGRMLEIKNIVNRDITGIPKEEYWIQTQVQMETCDLDECDFMETRFLEYKDEALFYEDIERDYRGVILHFIEKNMKRGSQPVYKYMPLDISLDKNSVSEWIFQTREDMRRDDFILFATNYWYLDEYSCVLIQRNKEWFNRAITKIKSTWEIIEKERINGYEHRNTKKKIQKMAISQNDSMNYVLENMPLTNSICLVKLE